MVNLLEGDVFSFNEVFDFSLEGSVAAFAALVLVEDKDVFG